MSTAANWGNKIRAL